jgi:hypothetical protein
MDGRQQPKTARDTIVKNTCSGSPPSTIPRIFIFEPTNYGIFKPSINVQAVLTLSHPKPKLLFHRLMGFGQLQLQVRWNNQQVAKRGQKLGHAPTVISSY